MDKIASALVKAQKAFGPALKSATNPHFKSRYADLAACVEAVIDALNANGIALVQRNIACESGITIETVFLHESGEMLSSGPLHVPAAKSDAQGYGSAMTYARRYSLMAACGIAPEDDDGNAAAKAKPRPAEPKPAEERSPAQIAARLIAGVEKGDASGAASYLASLDKSKLDAIWPLLPGEAQEALIAAWPKGDE